MSSKAPYSAGDPVRALYCDATTGGGTVLGTGTVMDCSPFTDRRWALVVDLGQGIRRDYIIRGRESDYVLPA